MLGNCFQVTDILIGLGRMAYIATICVSISSLTREFCAMANSFCIDEKVCI